MPEAAMTHHAARRVQQRGIHGEVLPLLMHFGAHQYDKHGAKLVYLTHRSKERIRRSVGSIAFRRIQPALDIYAVVGQDGAVITVGHRTHRINRN